MTRLQEWRDDISDNPGCEALYHAPLEELVDWLRSGGELTELESLTLLDEIADLRAKVNDLKQWISDCEQSLSKMREVLS